MNGATRRRWVGGALGAAAVALAARARAGDAEPVEARVEIAFLFGYIDGSACAFYRNGTWHEPPAALVHMREKYASLQARNQIASAEDFIEKVATRSSMSGEAYAVRCTSSASIPSATWLRAELAHLRGL
jgi:hypothetical protein